MTATAILFERDNVNDDVALLSRWLVSDGARVEEGTPIAEVETSKANIEVTAHRSGFLRHGVAEEREFSYALPLGHILDTAEEISVVVETKPKVPATLLPVEPASSPVMHAPVPAARIATEVTFSARSPYARRFSKQAKVLIAQYGLSEDDIQTHALVRATDLRRLVEPDIQQPQIPCVPAPAPQTPAPPPSQRLAYDEIPLSRTKAMEVQTLRAGTGAALPSTVTVQCPTRGLRAALSRSQVVAGSVGAVVLFETSRLLRKYPELNGTYRDGKALQYRDVHLGYAMNDGRGLKVAVIHNCDSKPLATVAEELRALVLRYLDDKLTPADMSDATFSISDLSGAGVAHFVPLISANQGAILGIGAEAISSGSAGSFSLSLTFDHQISEGRQAALFLDELRTRLAHYERTAAGAPEETLRCARCGRSTHELPHKNSFMVQSAFPPGYLCNLCMAGL